MSKDNNGIELKPGHTASVEIPKEKAGETKLDITVKVAKDEEKKPPKPQRGLAAFRNL